MDPFQSCSIAGRPVEATATQEDFDFKEEEEGEEGEEEEEERSIVATISSMTPSPFTSAYDPALLGACNSGNINL